MERATKSTKIVNKSFKIFNLTKLAFLLEKNKEPKKALIAPIPIPIPEQLAEFEAVAAAAGYDLSDPYVYAEASAKVAPLYPVYWAASSKEETMEELWRIVRMGESSNKWMEENMRDREDTEDEEEPAMRFVAKRILRCYSCCGGLGHMAARNCTR